MKKIIALDEKIKKYGLLSLSLSSASSFSTQVVYNDVNPDHVLNLFGSYYYFVDLNHDFVQDFTFSMQYNLSSISTSYFVEKIYDKGFGVAFYSSYINIDGSTNAWLGSSSPEKLIVGDIIGDNGNFQNNFGNLASFTSIITPLSPSYNFYVQRGNFTEGEGFIGIRFEILGAKHYGWIRVEVAPDGNSMTIKDYAYESSTGVPIVAGDIGGGNTVGIDNLSNDIIIRNLYNKLNIELVNADNASISLVNLAGQIILNDVMNSNSKMIELNGFSTGIYMVNVTTDKGMITKKVYVK